MNIIGRHFMITSINIFTSTAFLYIFDQTEDGDVFECNKKWEKDGNKFRTIIGKSRREKNKTNGNTKHT